MATSISTGQITGHILLAVYAPKEADHIKLVPLGGEVLFTPVDPVLIIDDGGDVSAVIAQPVRGILDARGAITDGEGEGVHVPVAASGTKWRVRFRARLADDLTVNIPEVTATVAPAGLNVSRIISGASILASGRVAVESVQTVNGIIQVVLPDGSTRDLLDPSIEAGEDETPPTPSPTTVARRLVVLGDSHSDDTQPGTYGVWWRLAADRAGVITVDSFAHSGWDAGHAITGWGDTPSQLVQAEESSADLAVVMFAGNDMVNGYMGEYTTNLETISNRLQASGKRVVIAFPPPLFSTLNTQYSAQYAQMRTMARQAAANTGAYYMDPWEEMAGPDGAANPAWDIGDSVHFNDAGHKAIGDALAGKLQEFAGVTDPLGGEPRTFHWTAPGQHYVTGDGTVTVESMYRDDPLFRSSSVARIQPGTGQTAVYADPGVKAGARVRVEYPFRITAAPGNNGYGAEDITFRWPGGFAQALPISVRVPHEGVRRYETVIPPEATEGFAVGPGFLSEANKPAELLVGDARITVISENGDPIRTVELGAPAYQPTPTEGTNGALTDAKNVTWANGTVSSVYHRKASHLTGSGPFPLVIHLHGDGYQEVTNYGNNVTTSVAYAYEKAAVDAGALFVMPRTPDTTNQTWYTKASSTTWLVAFIKMLKAQYNIDARRIFISGYSGGAEEITYNLVADYHDLFLGGGAMMLGGGGAEGLTGFTGVPSTQVKEDFLMRWWYGETDNGVAPSDTSIDAITASAEGEAWYAQRGFKTARTMIPGKNHYTSETDGPAKLTALIQESNQKYNIG